MGYGLRIFGRLGNVLIDATMRISRFIWNSAETSSSGSQILDGTNGTPNISGKRTVQFSIPINFPVPTGPNTTEQSSHAVSRSGATISWSAYTQNYSAGNCQILVFAYT